MKKTDKKLTKNSKSKNENCNCENEDQIKDIGSVITNSKGRKIYCLTIIGEIEGHYILDLKSKSTKYEHLIPKLVSIEEDETIAGLLILLNTVGGDVEAGLAISEMITGMKKPTVSLVLGGGHSIGVPLAVAAKKSFIVKSATMTVHPVRSTGMVLGVPQAFEYFQKMQERIANFVVENSKISFDRFYSLVMNTEELVLDIGSVLDGKKAVKEGLIDKIGRLSDAIECLHKMIDKR